LFATYTREAATGLDYANQRYYASVYGRFNSPDPFGGSAGIYNPGSWNRYAYSLGDPVNNYDPSGLECSPVESVVGTSDPILKACEETDDGGGGYYDPNATGAAAVNTTTITYEDGSQETFTGVQDFGSPSLSLVSLLPPFSITGTVGVPMIPEVPITVPLSMIGVGATFTVIPSTGTTYFGPTFSLSTPGNSIGISATVWGVPPGIDPGKILGGTGVSITIQPTPARGISVAASPGTAGILAGPTVGTKTPGSLSAGYGFCQAGCFQAQMVVGRL
jgi:RHS repeat-associated protein